MTTIYEPSHLAPSMVDLSFSMVVADLVQKGPIKLLLYSANGGQAISPSYANSEWINRRLLCETIVPAPQVDNQKIIFSNIPTMINLAATGSIDILEIRSTVDNVLYFRLEGDHRRVSLYDTVALTSVVVQDKTLLTVAPQQDLFPETAPFPIDFKIEFPSYLNDGTNYVSNVALTFRSDNYIYPNYSLVAPNYTNTQRIRDQLITNPYGDWWSIEGNYSNTTSPTSRESFDFTYSTTHPSATDTSNHYFTLSMTALWSSSEYYNNAVVAVPVIKRKKYGENTLVSIPVTQIYTLNDSSQRKRIRTYSFKLTA